MGDQVDLAKQGSESPSTPGTTMKREIAAPPAGRFAMTLFDAGAVLGCRKASDSGHREHPPAGAGSI